MVISYELDLCVCSMKSEESQPENSKAYPALLQQYVTKLHLLDNSFILAQRTQVQADLCEVDEDSQGYTKILLSKEESRIVKHTFNPCTREEEELTYKSFVF